MKKHLLLAFLFSFTYFTLHSQCNGSTEIPSGACGIAPVICDLDGYCATTTNSNPTDIPPTFCPGSSVDNNQWFAFVAGTPNVTLQILVGTCQGVSQPGGGGMQGQVFGGCADNGWPTVSNCLSQIMPNTTGTLTMNNLTVGGVYYLMLDGWAGDQCEYEVDVTQGSAVPPPIGPMGPIMDEAGLTNAPLLYCPGANSATFSVTPVSGAGLYDWTIPFGAVIIGDLDGPTITLDLSNSSGGQLCVLPNNGCEFGAQQCTNIAEGPAPTGPQQDYVFCPGESQFYGNTLYDQFSPPSSVNMDFTNAQGCPIETTITVAVGQAYDYEIPGPVYICQGDSYSIGNETYTFSGYYTNNNMQTTLGCDSIVSVDLEVLDPSSGINPNVPDIDCGPNQSVNLEAIVTTNSLNVTYMWTGPCIDPNQNPNGSTIQVNCAGTYTLQVVRFENDNNGATINCSSNIYSITVGENTNPPTADPGNPQTVDCSGAAVTLGGPGTPSGNYAYSWTGPNGYTSIEQNPSVTLEGFYCLVVFDLTTDCVSGQECVQVTGDTTPPDAVAGASVTTLTCGTNSSSTLQTTGSASGTGVTYSWTGPNGALSGSNPTVTSGGTYTLTVSGSGCTNTATVTIGEDNGAPTAAITSNPNALDCNNTTLTLDGSSSTGNALTYAWSTGETTSSISVTTGMTYTLTVTAANQCTDTETFVVNDNSATLMAQITTQGSINCTPGSSVTLSATNVSGTTTPTYVWTDDMGNSVGSTASITVSNAGTYTLVVQDTNNGCASTPVSEVIVSNNNPPTAVAGSDGDLSCNNQTTSVNSNGSTTGANITTTWQDAGGNNVDPSMITVGGTYTLTVTNTDNDCADTETVIVGQNNDTPTAVLTNSAAAIDCTNPTLTLDASTSTGNNLTYNWSTSETSSSITVGTDGNYSVTVTNSVSGCFDVASFQVDDNSAVLSVIIDNADPLTCVNNMTTLTAINVMGTNNPTYVWTDDMGNSVGTNAATITVGAAGTYNLVIQDAASGCSSAPVSEIVGTDNNPPTANATVSGEINCENASVVLSSAGSTTGGNISVEWQNASGDIVDPNNITIDGDYTLIVTDMNNGCDDTSVVPVIENIVEPTATISDNVPLNCDINSITLSAANSTGNNLTYAWSTGGTAATETISSAQVVTLTVTDETNGCTNQTTANVVDNTTTVSVAATSSNALTCQAQEMSTTLEATNLMGTNNPTYTWTDENGVQVGGNTATVTATVAGVYTLLVEDVTTGCQGTTTVTVTESIDAPVSVVETPVELTCTVASVTLDGSNSTSGNDFTYQWFNGATPVPGGTTAIISVTMEGDYTLVVSNTSNGCETTSAVAAVVLNDDEPIAVAVADNGGMISCASSTLTIDGTGSTGNNITYEWTDANGNILGTMPTYQVSAQGDVTLTVTNQDNGCTDSEVVSITPNSDIPNFDIDPVTQIDCNNMNSLLVGSGSSNSGGTVSVEWQDSLGATVSTTGQFQTNTPGQYTFVVTDDNNNCSVSSSVTIVEDMDAPDAIVGNDQTINCLTDMVTLNGSSSSNGADFTYQWFDENDDAVPGATFATLTTMTAGQYTLVVTDNSNGCTMSDDVMVFSDLQEPVIVADAPDNIDCNNGTVSLLGTVSTSASTDLVYEWRNSTGGIISTELNATTMTDGTYTFVVIDNGNGCAAQTNVVVITDTDAPVAVAAASDNGTLNCDIQTLTLDGDGSSAVGNFSYSWLLNNMEVSTDLAFDVSDDGLYTLVVTNEDNGCSSEINVSIIEDVAAPSAIAAASNPSLTCTDPVVTLDGSSSSIGANFTYQWFDVVTGDQISDEISVDIGTAGTYELIVTDTNNGCDFTSNQVSISQSADVPVAIIEGGMVELTCATEQVILDGSNSTATGTIEYRWLNEDGDVIGTDATLTVTTPGQVTLSIEDMGNGCTSSDFTTVIQDIEAPQVSTIMTADLINCNQPTITLDGSDSNLDPNANYTFEWTLGTEVVGTDLVIPNIDIAGTYLLTILNTDNGCDNAAQVVVTADNDPPLANAGNNFTIDCDINVAPLDGSASSTGDFSYAWVNQDGDTVSTQINDMTGQPGTYVLVVTDNQNGCSTTSSAIEVVTNVVLPAAILGTAPTITCFDNQEVTLDGSASEAGNNITYQWLLNGNPIDDATSVFYTTSEPGEYTLVVSNTSTGCDGQDSYTVTTDLAQPTADAGTGGTLICGQASFTLDGTNSSALGNFSYQWLDETGNVVSTDTIFEAGAAGNYLLVVTNDDNGCSQTSNTVSIIPDTNSPEISVAPIAMLTCNVQTVTLDASNSMVSMGSAGTLTFEWTDTSGNVIGTTPTIDVSEPGQVNLLITDNANNCSSSSPYNVNQDIEAPESNAGNGGVLLCDGNDVLLDGGGSSSIGNIAYAWINSNGDTVSTEVTYSAGTPGDYTLVVTNLDNGCAASSLAAVTEDINVPSAIVIFPTTDLLTCDVESIVVDGSTSTSVGGANLTYAWSTGENTETITITNPGIYSLTVIDANNECEGFFEFEIMENVAEPTADIVSINNTNTLSCTQQSLVYNGGNSSAGGATVTYEWTLDGIVVGTDEEIEVSEDGTLMLTVTNTDNGCSSNTTVSIDTDASLPTAFINNPQELDCILDEISLTATASTGTEYEYTWTGPGIVAGGTTLEPTIDAPGTYILVVTNTTNGCDATASMVVTENINPPAAMANAMNQFDCVTDEVTLTSDGSATGAGINYAWTTDTGVFVSGANTANPTVAAPGIYTLTVSNSNNGCENTSSVEVTANTDVPSIVNTQVIDPNCFGENNGSISLTEVTGGQLPYLYSIDGGALSPVNQFGFLSAGDYLVEVEDANGCTSTTSLTVNNPEEVLVELGDDIIIKLGDTIRLVPQLQGVDTLIWSSCGVDSSCIDASLINISPLNSTTYSLTGMNDQGCEVTDRIVVNVEKDRFVYIPNIFTPNGDGINETFQIFPGQEVTKVHYFRIFNRWGEEVYSREDYVPTASVDSEGWDGSFRGKKLNPQVFVYYLELEYLDGRKEILRGDVALRR